MRALLTLGLILALSASAGAQATAPSPPPAEVKIPELDLWKLRALAAEKALYQERLEKIAIIHGQVKSEHDAKGRAITEAAAASLQAAGLDGKGYEVDLDRGVWRKRGP